MDDARNALFVLNTLVAVPSALLVADVRELRDGPVLIDVVAHLQAVWRGLSPQAPATRIDGVLSALEWLGETFGTASFPPLLARPPAIVAAAVAAGDARTIATIVHFVQARLNEADMLGGKGGEGVMLHVGGLGGGGRRPRGGSSPPRSVPTASMPQRSPPRVSRQPPPVPEAKHLAPPTPAQPRDTSRYVPAPLPPPAVLRLSAEAAAAAAAADGEGHAADGGVVDMPPLATGGGHHRGVGGPLQPIPVAVSRVSGGRSGMSAPLRGVSAAEGGVPPVTTPPVTTLSVVSEPRPGLALTSSALSSNSSNVQHVGFAPPPPEAQPVSNFARLRAAAVEALAVSERASAAAAAAVAAASAASAAGEESGRSRRPIARGRQPRSSADTSPPRSSSIGSRRTASSSRSQSQVSWGGDSVNGGGGVGTRSGASSAPSSPGRTLGRAGSGGGEAMTTAAGMLSYAGSRAGSSSSSYAGGAAGGVSVHEGVGGWESSTLVRQPLGSSSSSNSVGGASASTGGAFDAGAATTPHRRPHQCGAREPQMDVVQLSPSRAARALHDAQVAAAEALRSGRALTPRRVRVRPPVIPRPGLRVAGLVDPSYIPRIALPLDGRWGAPLRGSSTSVSGSNSAAASTAAAMAAAAEVAAAEIAEAASAAPLQGGSSVTFTLPLGTQLASRSTLSSGSTLGSLSSGMSGLPATVSTGGAAAAVSTTTSPSRSGSAVSSSAAAERASAALSVYLSLCSPSQAALLAWVDALGVDITLQGRAGYSTAPRDDDSVDSGGEEEHGAWGALADMDDDSVDGDDEVGETGRGLGSPSLNRRMGARVRQRLRRTQQRAQAPVPLAPPLPNTLLDPSDLATILADGVALSEIIAACEARSGNRLPAALVRAPRGVGGADDIGAAHRAGGGVLVSRTATVMLAVLPGTVLPRDGILPFSAALKNWELSLNVLRARPRFPPRCLWVTKELIDADKPALAWALLEDVRRSYGAVAVAAVTTPAPASSAAAPTVVGVPPPPSFTATHRPVPPPFNSVPSAAPPPLRASSPARDPLSLAQRLPPAALGIGVTSAGGGGGSVNSLRMSDLGGGGGSVSGSVTAIQPQPPPSPGRLSTASSRTLAVTGEARGSLGLGPLLDPTLVRVSGGALARYVLPSNLQEEADGQTLHRLLLPVTAAQQIALGTQRVVPVKPRVKPLLSLCPAPLPVPARIAALLPSLVSSGHVHGLAPGAGADAFAPPQPTATGFVRGGASATVLRGRSALAAASGLPSASPAAVPSLLGLASATAALPPISYTEALRVRAWLVSLGLGKHLPGNAAVSIHTLDNPLLNGVLLAELAVALEKETPPLGGSNASRCFPHPRSFPEARANLEAALTVFRASRLTKEEMGAAAAAAAARGRPYAGVSAPLPQQHERVRRDSLGGEDDGGAAAGGEGAASVASYGDGRRRGSGYDMPAWPPSPQRAPESVVSQGASAFTAASATGFAATAAATAAAALAPPPFIPEHYLFCAEEHLVGNSDAAWGLLAHLAACYTFRATVQQQQQQDASSSAAVHAGTRRHQRSGSSRGRAEGAVSPTPSRSHSLSSVGGGSTVPASPPQASSTAMNGGSSSSVAGGVSIPRVTGAAPPRVLLSSPSGRTPPPRSQGELVEWSAHVGALEHAGCAPSAIALALDVGSLDPILGHVCDGSLLGAIASLLMGRPLASLTHAPRTPAVARANVVKACAALRSVPGFPLKWLALPGVEEAIFSGRLSEACGVLSDAAAFHTAHVARDGGAGWRALVRTRKWYEPPPPPPAQPVDHRATLTSPSRSLAPLPLAARSPPPRGLRGGDGGDGGEGASSASMVGTGGAVVNEAAPLVEVTTRLAAEAATRVALAEATAAAEKEEAAAAVAAAAAQAAAYVTSLAAGGGGGNGEPPLATILQWLSRLGVTPARPEALGNDAEAASEWADGVLLCDVVAACEVQRGVNRQALTSGIDRTPRTAGARLGNLRRALEVLRGLPAMPLTLLWSEMELRAGSALVFRKLLGQIRRAYGHHLRA